MGRRKKTEDENPEPIPEVDYKKLGIPLSKCCDAPLGTLRTCTKCGERC